MHPLHDRVLEFIAAPDESGFEALALDVFRHQFEHIEPYRRFCERRGALPERIAAWTDIPPVPVQVFKEIELACAPAEIRFRSSGTTRGPQRRSVHAIADLRLYRAAALGGLRRFLLPDFPRLRILSLIHPLAERAESSLVRMVAWALEELGTAESVCAVENGELLPERAAATVRLSEQDGAPLAILATTASLLRFLDHCGERGWSFRLPHGSRVMDTGGSKGLARPVSRNGLHHAVWNSLAVPGYFFANEYGMTELSSQAWENVIADRVAGRFRRRALATPPWLRTRVLDPATLAEAPRGQRGLLCHLDLANAGSAVAVLTEDVGMTTAEGFLVLGRAKGAEARGCSLVWEGQA